MLKVLVTGVAGQLGHDVMNELANRGYYGIGTDIAECYAGVQDDTAVTKMPYVQLDITNKNAVNKTISEIKPDVVVHCAAWTAVDNAEDEENREKVFEINVNDQIGTPTYTYDLARLLVDMIETDKYGYYHATNEGGYISWYDFACEIFKQANYTTTVKPVTTEQYGISKASRPFNSRLDKSKLTENGFKPLPTWQDALKRYLQEIKY